MNDDRRFLLAIVLSVLILVAFHYVHVAPPPPPAQPAVAVVPAPVETKAAADAHPVAVPQIAKLRPRTEVIKESERITVETPELSGSINLKGAVIDDLQL